MRRERKDETGMKHKRSLEALIVGFVLTIAVSFFSTKIAGAVLAVSLIQMFLFYRCPHCGYGLYNVCERIRLNFGENYGITITSTYGEGTCVTVRLPQY